MNEDKASTDRQKLQVRCQGEDSTSHVEGRSLTLPLLLPTKLLRPRYWISWLTGEAHRLQSWSCLCDGLISRVRQWISATPILSLNNISCHFTLTFDQQDWWTNSLNWRGGDRDDQWVWWVNRMRVFGKKNSSEERMLNANGDEIVDDTSQFWKLIHNVNRGSTGFGVLSLLCIGFYLFRQR